jgi:hypothetical protein
VLYFDAAMAIISLPVKCIYTKGKEYKNIKMSQVKSNNKSLQRERERNLKTEDSLSFYTPSKELIVDVEL